MTCDERISKLKSFLTGTLQQAKQSLSSEREREREQRKTEYVIGEADIKMLVYATKRVNQYISVILILMVLVNIMRGNIRQSARCLKLLR